jgi:DNA polymerase-4
LEVRKLWGVGPKAKKIMTRANIRSVADIQARTKEEMIALFGEAGGTHYWNMANAVDLREVCDDEAAKSISHETTFLADVQDPEVLHRTLLWLADKVASRLRRHGLHGRVITLKYRTERFKTFTRQTTLSQCVHDTNIIFETSKTLMRKVGIKKGLVRLLGIGVSGLESRQGLQRSLFGGERTSREHATESAVDRVRRKFGSDSIVRGSLLKQKPDENKSEPGDSGRS